MASVKAGDNFLIPIGQKYCPGQIAGKYKQSLYVCIFDALVDDESGGSKAISGMTPFIGACTLDAFFFHGFWHVVDNTTVDRDVILTPVFKVEYNGRTYVESFEGELLRPATPEEVEFLRYRVVVAPVRVDKAVKAHFGDGPWEPAYENLRYSYAAESAGLTA
jgi:hypothetical protein